MQLDYQGYVDPSLGREHIGIRILGSTQRGKEVALRPGVNTLTDEEWAAVKDSAGAKHLVSTGQLRELKGKDGKGAFNLVRDSNPSEALKLVKRTSEPGPLREWQAQVAKAGDAWQHVAKALDAQILDVTTDVDGKPAEQRPLKMAG